MSVVGVDKVIAALGRLPESTRKKGLRGGVRAGLNVIKNQAKANIAGLGLKEPTGLLAKSIIVKSLKARTKGDIRGAVAISAKAISKKGQRVALYGSVLEHGKENQPPRPFLRPAIAAKSQEAIDKIAQYVGDNFDKIVKDAKQ